MISALTLCATVFIAVAGFIINTLLQRKNNSIKVITGHRLERKREMTRLVSILLTYSDPCCLAWLDEEGKKATMRKICAAANTFRTLFYVQFEEDRKFIQQVYSFRKRVNEMLVDGQPGDGDGKEALLRKYEALNPLREELMKSCDLYSETDWTRIKEETVGRSRKSARRNWMKAHKRYSDNYPEGRCDG